MQSEFKGNLIPTKTIAYKISGIKKRPQELKVIHGIMPTTQIIKLAKQYKVTMSSFLTSLLIYSIYVENAKFSCALTLSLIR